MTRKCVLCKETNYKNSYSFFSAPKDAETRKKWQEAIGVKDYVVNDETFVCSRHFTPGDIITHWVSGVPPHVVTIKYKKCRLRPGAVPSVNCDIDNMQLETDDDYEVFQVNRTWGNDERVTFTDGKDQVFLIPRADLITYSNSEIQNNSSEKTKEDDNELVYITQTIDEANSTLEEHGDMIVVADDQMQDLKTLEVDESYTVRDSDNTIYLKANDNSQLVYIEEVNYPEENGEKNEKEKTNESATNEVKDYESQDEESLKESVDWNSIDTEKGSNDAGEERTHRNYDDLAMDVLDPLDEEPMLFEDLLDVYNEVRLPRGWSTMVISAGRATTVIYARMNMTQTGVPYVQKQVFLKSDMNFQCSAAGKQLNPLDHNLFPDGRSFVVRGLRDVEEFIEEFDQRVICDGLEKMSSLDVDNVLMYRQDVKWRHNDCSILMKSNGTRCSKCNSLSLPSVRRKLKKPSQLSDDVEKSAELVKKDQTIYELHKLLSKMTKRNEKYETMKDDPQTFIKMIEALNIPEVQKLMIKESLNATSNNDNVNFTQTWLFLALVIYIESPRMYRFLLQNQYMNLPSIQVMRRYLHQIKTDAQFYKLFQQTVEPFQTKLEDKEIT
ncbi:uncharacterized protein LOC123274918 [Cotesia glomerata]|uniref:THAP-type domain-containing protein n=1 Tax=Cotesia glomerata TaxID=32391 RepID=A0AAV7IZT2_COTGL|nr:uncharacterized protein LOC123274918 [Cotesia glomerata]KAH0562758.1 hypothetical protein KQX54_001097 [Cotesia glomerata]